jgi:PAS domain S-box-containing protein
MVEGDGDMHRHGHALAAGAMAQALMASERRFQALAEVSLQGKLVHRRFLPLFANRAFALLAGCDIAEEITDRLDVLTLLDDETRSDPERAWEAAVRGPVCGRRVFRRRDGTLYPVEIYSRPIDWDGAEAVALAVLDVSQEENARQALADANALVESAARSRRQFLVAADAELRGPVSAMEARLAALSQTDVQAREAFEHCRDLSRRLDTMLAAAQPLPPAASAHERFELTEVLAAAIDRARPAGEAMGVRIASAPRLDAALMGDPDMVGRLADAMLGAAVRRAPGRAATIEAAIDAGGVVISVRAEGCCALAEDIDPAFDPLMAARRLASALSGVLVEWKELRDAWCASVFLPLQRLEDTDGLPAALALDVLVAEDGPGARALLKIVLESLGHRPHLVANGAEAAEAARVRRFDVAVMDIQMPGVNGLEAARAIRAMSGAGGDLPIVALTSLTTQTMREQVAEAGMDAFLSKPLDIPRLAETLALLANGRLVDAALGDQIHHEDENKESNNDAGRGQGHRVPSG